MNILLINGGKAFGAAQGRLSRTLHDEAKAVLAALGHAVRETHIDEGYDIETEVENFLWMDAVIYQMPGWWMGEPWIVKRYIDEVFTAGRGRLFANDGRSSEAPQKNYGTGGLLHGKRHMLSLTWNAPAAAFNDPQEFFGSIGADGVYLPFHKAQQFLGLAPLPTFIAHDVMKAPDVPRYLADYRNHLQQVFGSAQTPA